MLFFILVCFEKNTQHIEKEKKEESSSLASVEN